MVQRRKMKLRQRFTKRIATLTIAAIAITVMAGAVYAAVSLTVQNTVTITVGAPNLFMDVTGITSTTICPTNQGAYTDTGLSISWGNMAQGTSANTFACLSNTGAQHILAISNNLPASSGTATLTIGGTNANGQTVNGGTFTLVDLTLAIDQNAAPGTVPFTITVA